MSQCPKCKRKITTLNAVCIEETVQTVEVEDGYLGYNSPDAQQITKIYFKCPECGATLFSNNGDDNDKNVINFLSNTKEKVQFT